MAKGFSKPSSLVRRLEVSRGKLKVIKCDYCTKEFLAGGIEFQTKKAMLVDREGKREEIEILFYECPHCQHKYVINLDNEQTTALKTNYQLNAEKLTAKIKSGKNPSHQEMYALERRKEILAGFYKELQERFPPDTYRQVLSSPDSKSN